MEIIVPDSSFVVDFSNSYGIEGGELEEIPAGFESHEASNTCLVSVEKDRNVNDPKPNTTIAVTSDYVVTEDTDPDGLPLYVVVVYRDSGGANVRISDPRRPRPLTKPGM
mgnify:FL=1